jgi:hypothetical protein
MTKNLVPMAYKARKGGANKLRRLAMYGAGKGIYNQQKNNYVNARLTKLNLNLKSKLAREGHRTVTISQYPFGHHNSIYWRSYGGNPNSWANFSRWYNASKMAYNQGRLNAAGLKAIQRNFINRLSQLLKSHWNVASNSIIAKYNY